MGKNVGITSAEPTVSLKKLLIRDILLLEHLRASVGGPSCSLEGFEIRIDS